LSILEMRSPEMVRDVFVFILPLYYQGGILATNGRSTSWVALTSNGSRPVGCHRCGNLLFFAVITLSTQSVW
jgi:hypothetical protein